MQGGDGDTGNACDYSDIVEGGNRTSFFHYDLSFYTLINFTIHAMICQVNVCNILTINIQLL